MDDRRGLGALLAPYGAPPGEIRGAADGVQSHALSVGDISNGVDYWHARAQGAVDGLLAGPMASAPGGARQTASAVQQRTLFAGAAAKLFARHVDGYNHEVAVGDADGDDELDRYDQAWDQASRTSYNEMWADANGPGG